MEAWRRCDNVARCSLEVFFSFRYFSLCSWFLLRVVSCIARILSAPDIHFADSGMSLSKCAAATLSQSGSSLLWQVTANQWHVTDNPQGYVSLGMAENTLMQAALCERIAAVPPFPPRALTYGDGTTGSHKLKAALAAFLTRYFHTWQPVAPTHLTVTNGCSAALEHLFWALGDPDDCFLVTQPFFRAFIPTVELRIRRKLVLVSCQGADSLGSDVIKHYEAAILSTREAGRCVKGIILCNPHNPLGRCYPSEVIIGLMELCCRYDLHLISDEVYGLSTWENRDDPVEPTSFTSCLSINTTGIISQSQVHVVWGASKDFGSNGIRLGTIVSRGNISLHESIVPGALYSMVSSLADHIYSEILADFNWVDHYLHQNSKALAENYKIVAGWAQKHRIPYATGSNAGFFIWINIGDAYRKLHPAIEAENVENHVMDLLLERRVFVANGRSFGSEDNGWFRIVFSVDRVNLMEGLERVAAALRC